MRLATVRYRGIPAPEPRIPADGFCIPAGFEQQWRPLMAPGPIGIRPVRRILVGWDCSPGAAAAMHAAAAVAADRAATIVVLAVLRPAPRAEETAEGAADFDERRRFAQETFAKAWEGLPAVLREHVSLRFAESGDAAGTVCEYASQHGFDLLVLGRHGNGGVLHPRLGHVAAAAARKAALPVLLAP
jgi:nucleotide-binding universal stress UspA family protein